MKKKIIYGCESRGDGADPYLTRYTLISNKYFQVAIHVFHRSDFDDLHDHPWDFVSIILWRGYIEETFSHTSYFHRDNYRYTTERKVKKRYWPGMILFRKAEHAHRVELVNGKKAVTLVFMGKYVRNWGFYTSKGWRYFLHYFKENKC